VPRNEGERRPYRWFRKNIYLLKIIMIFFSDSLYDARIAIFPFYEKRQKKSLLV
jgi:hypothetical protein